MPEKQKMQTVYKQYDFIRSTTLRMPAFGGQAFPKIKRIYNLIDRAETKVIFMEPILTNATLDHLHLLIGLWIRIRPVAGAIRAHEVVIV